MTPAEIAWRVRQVGVGRLEEIATARRSQAPSMPADWARLAADFRAGADRPVLLDRERAAQIAHAHPERAAGVVAAADRAAAGRFSFFGYPEACAGTEIDWWLDPLAGVRWPDRPAGRIDHRRAAGDVKWIWELNRLQHLPLLAQAWLFTGRERYADIACRHLSGWLRQNPPGVGIAWRGAFEAGVRAISVAVALQGLRDAPALTDDLLCAAVTMLAGSAHRCLRDRSRYSSANNHLIGELAGAVTVASILPELPGAARWRQTGLELLAAEADRQILADGAGAEQSAAYQIFTTELLMVVIALVRLGGGRAPDALIAAVDRGADYLAAVVGAEAPDPRYGDDDEGFALRLGPEPVRTVRDHLGVVAALTGHRVAGVHGRATVTSAWLAGAYRPPREDSGVQSARSAAGVAGVYAPHGGLVTLWGPAGRRVQVDVGPLGYLSIAAHGHADALAATLSYGPAEVIVDPGAGSYYRAPAHRRLHRGTRVHATAEVDGCDQSVAGGPFLWTGHAQVRVRAVDLVRGIVDAEHNGYRRLPGRPVHRRWVIAPPGRAEVVVVDRICGAGRHRLRVGWPIHPGLDAELASYGCLLSGARGPLLRLRCAADAPVTFGLHRGDSATGLGWYSTRLERRVPAPLFALLAGGPAPLTAVTVIEPAGGAQPGPVTVAAGADAVLVAWTGAAGAQRVRIDLVGDGCVAWEGNT